MILAIALAVGIATAHVTIIAPVKVISPAVAVSTTGATYSPMPSTDGTHTTFNFQ